MEIIEDDNFEEKYNCFSFIKEESPDEETHENQSETSRKYSCIMEFISHQGSILTMEFVSYLQNMIQDLDSVVKNKYSILKIRKLQNLTGKMN